MTKSKKAVKAKKVLPPKLTLLQLSQGSPSEECKNAMIECMVQFYDQETTMSLDSKYVRYGEECALKFKPDMAQRMLDALNIPKWKEDMEKQYFQKCLNDKTHDALWNSKDVLEQYGRENERNDEAFQQLLLKVNLFREGCAAFAKRCNRFRSVGWWVSLDGIAEAERDRRHLIALPDMARVIQVDETTKRGGYATIRRVRIEGCPGILPYWEFAAKKSIHYQTKPELAKLEHQNESMAVRIPHVGVIRFAAVHATSYEGYAYWWNDETLRQMLNMDNDYPDNIFIHLMYSQSSDEEVIRAHYLGQFRKKHTELAWAFIHIMNAVHVARHLHNDISLDNIMLHFPGDESRVYIGVCDWGLTTLATEPMKSLYTFTSAIERTETLHRRWWVDPEIAYLYRKDVDVQTIPHYSRASEEFAVGKIAQRINNQCMSVAYYNLQRKSAGTSRFQHHEFGQVFHAYLERLCTKGAGGLAHVITCFTRSHNWPIPDEHFCSSYI